MDQTLTIVVIVAIVLAIAIALLVALSRRSRLRALPPESRDKYAQSWQAVETRFIDDPRGAVQEADKIAVMILGERGATIHDERKVPNDLKHAREAARSDEGRQGTEGMRKAMVHYKRIVQDSLGLEPTKKPEDVGPETTEKPEDVGPETTKKPEDVSRREVAS
ncbi:MAG TPA: hypothetical protein VGK28_01640 [Candidatus Dormibacteraeota bacterium]